MLAAVQDAGQLHHDVPGVGNSMRAYCLAELGQTDEAKEILEMAKGRSTLAVNHAIRSVGLMKLGEVDSARQEMARALRRGITRSGCYLTATLADCFDIYAHRATQDDMLYISRKSRHNLRRFMLDVESIKDHSTFVKAWNRWLTNLPINALDLDDSAHANFLRSHQVSLLLRDTRRLERIHDALALFTDIYNRGQIGDLSRETCYRLVSTLCQLQLPEEAATILSLVISKLPISNPLLTEIAKMYAKTHTIDDGTIEQFWEAGQLGSKKSETDRLAMASIRAAKGDLPGVVKLFEGTPEPKSPSSHLGRCRAHLRAAIKSGNLPAAKQYLSSIISIRSDHMAFNSVLKMAVDMDEAQRAQQIFTQFEEAGHTPNVMAHTTLIGLHARRGESDLADLVFDSMIEKGIEPDATAWAALLNAHIEAGNWDGVGERYGAMPVGHRTHGDVVSAVMKALVLKGSPLTQVLELFRTLEHPTSHHWSLMVQSASDHNDLHLMETLFREMESLSQASGTTYKPNVYVYSILLHAYLKANEAERSRATYDEMLQKGIVPTSVTYSMIISSYANGTAHGSLQRAQEFAMSIHRLSTTTDDGHAITIDKGKRRRASPVENLLSPLVVAAGRAGNIQQAAENFEMIKKSAEPSIPTYSRYLDVWRKAHEPSMVMRIWAEIFTLGCRTISMTPSSKSRRSRSSDVNADSTSSPLIPKRQPENALAVPLSIVLITLGREKRISDIRRVWDEVRNAGFGFDASNFNQLAVSLAQAGDVEGAFDVVENVLLDPSVTNHATGLDEFTASASIPFGTTSMIHDATESAFRPPNRRSESMTSIEPIQSSTRSIPEHLSSTLADTTWRPNFHTLLTLESVVSQLESNPDNRAWMGLATTEEGEDDPDGELYGTFPTDANANDNAGDMENEAGVKGLVALPGFGTYVRESSDGRPKRTSARGLLMKLNRKYSKAMALVMFHRKKMNDKRRMNGGRSKAGN